MVLPPIASVPDSPSQVGSYIAELVGKSRIDLRAMGVLQPQSRLPASGASKGFSKKGDRLPPVCTVLPALASLEPLLLDTIDGFSPRRKGVRHRSSHERQPEQKTGPSPRATAILEKEQAEKAVQAVRRLHPDQYIVGRRFPLDGVELQFDHAQVDDAQVVEWLTRPPSSLTRGNGQRSRAASQISACVRSPSPPRSHSNSNQQGPRSPRKRRVRHCRDDVDNPKKDSDGGSLSHSPCNRCSTGRMPLEDMLSKIEVVPDDVVQTYFKEEEERERKLRLAAIIINALGDEAELKRNARAQEAKKELAKKTKFAAAAFATVFDKEEITIMEKKEDTEADKAETEDAMAKAALKTIVRAGGAWGKRMESMSFGRKSTGDVELPPEKTLERIDPGERMHIESKRRTLTETARLLVFGAIGNEDCVWTRDKDAMLCGPVGSKEEVLEFWKAWRTLDTNRHGKVEVDEIRGLARRLKRMKIGDKIVQILKRLQLKDLTLDDSLRLCWPCAQESDVLWMRAVIDEQRNAAYKVATPPVLEKDELNGLKCVFGLLLAEARKSAAEGTGNRCVNFGDKVPVDLVVERGYLDIDLAKRNIKLWACESDESLNELEFVQMLVPSGRRVAVDSTRAVDEDGKLIVNKPMFGWIHATDSSACATAGV